MIFSGSGTEFSLTSGRRPFQTTGTNKLLREIKEGNRAHLYYLKDYIILYFFLLSKNEKASKNVGTADKPKIISQSFASIETVWKIG